MGMSVEEYEKWKNHPRVVVSADDDYVLSLTVDGVVIWNDGNHEPEDMSLTRDLSVFVDAIRDGYDSSKPDALEAAANVCESMVVGGRAWTHDQSVAASALFAAANAIRALGKKPETDHRGQSYMREKISQSIPEAKGVYVDYVEPTSFYKREKEGNNESPA